MRPAYADILPLRGKDPQAAGKRSSWAFFVCLHLISQFKGYSLGPLGLSSPNIAQRHALHVERTAEKAPLGQLLYDTRVALQWYVLTELFTHSGDSEIVRGL